MPKQKRKAPAASFSLSLTRSLWWMTLVTAQELAGPTYDFSRDQLLQSKRHMHRTNRRAGNDGEL